MKTKTSFSQNDLFNAIDLLLKVWEYEGTVYDNPALSAQEISDLDSKKVSYGIRLGTLRGIFQNNS